MATTDPLIDKMATVAYESSNTLFRLEADLREKGLDAQSDLANDVAKRLYRLYLDLLSTTQPL